MDESTEMQTTIQEYEALITSLVSSDISPEFIRSLAIRNARMSDWVRNTRHRVKTVLISRSAMQKRPRIQ